MPAALTRTTTFALAFCVLGLLALLVALPHGEMAPNGRMVYDPQTRGHEWVHDDARMTTHALANAAGGYAVLLTLVSMALPYLKRPKLHRRHGRIGVAILALAGVHAAMYLAEGSFRGWLPGLLSFAAFAVHGATRVWKARLLRAWGASAWKLTHRGSAWTALALVVEHILVASWHFGLARWFEEAGW